MSASRDSWRAKLVSAGDADEVAIVLEGAHGKGRFVVTSLFFDKLKGDKDEPDARQQFFDGLAAYVRAVKAGTAPDVTPVGRPRDTRT